MKNIGIVILAGGNSSRMGKAKQTLVYRGRTLLETTVEQAIKADLGPVVVVVGAYADQISSVVPEVELVYNPQWEKGMGSSIAAGVRAMEEKGVEALVLCVSDQPFLHAPVLRRLAAGFPRYQKVASAYGGSIGVPCLFGKRHFEALKHVEQGAKHLLLGEDTLRVPFPEGNRDVDTPEAYAALEAGSLVPDEALALMYQRIPSPRSVRVPLHKAGGLVLAEDVFAELDLPPFPQSSMDGYALRYEDRNVDLRIVGELRAGAFQALSVGRAEAVRVFTGAPVPEGADTVIMQEKVELQGANIRCREEEMEKGMHLRAVGSEVKKGELAVAKGTVLRSAAVGYLASLGRTDVLVRSQPKVTLVLTGDELVAPGNALEYGQVYESNSLALRSAFAAEGIEDVRVLFARDEREGLRAALEEALDSSDLVVSVGGVSVGAYDLVVPVAEEMGVKTCFHKVSQKPGKPLYFGTKGHTWCVGLPGNPSSALVCFYVYLRPVLQEWMGKEPAQWNVRARTMAAFPKKRGLRHFLKAWYKDGEVWPLQAQESFRLHTFKEANALVVLPEDGEGAKVGDTVEVMLLP